MQVLATAIRAGWWLYVAGALLPLRATAGPPDSTATLMARPAAPPVEELVARALAVSPTIAALRARVQEAREFIKPAGALPNPMLELMVQDMGFPKWTVGQDEMSMVGPQISQAFPFPGKRGARRGVARAEAEVAGVQYEQVRRQVVRDVRAVYARLYSLDHQARSLGSAAELLEMLTTTVNQRYAAGLTEQEAAIKAQLSRTRLDERLADLTAERLGLISVLNRLLDLPGETDLGEVGSLPTPNVPEGSWEAAVLEHSAEVARQRAAVKVAESKVRAAHVELRPDLLARAGVGFRGPFDPAVTFGVGIELPLWNGQNKRPLLRAAEAGLEAARQDLRDAEARARTDAARIAADWRKAQDQITRYDQALIPRTSLALNSARTAYLSGRGDFSTVIEDFNLWLEARAGLAQREAERFMAWTELDALLNASDGDRRGDK